MRIPMRHHFPTYARGLSLLELMVTIVVAAVLLGIAVPNMMAFARNNRLTSAANDLLVGIHIARTEAVKQRVPTAMCFTTDSTATTPSCNGSGKEGWVSWVDSDNDFVIDASEQILVRHGPIASSLTVKTKPAGNAGYIGYMSTGFVRVVANDLTGVVLCDSRGNVALYNNGPSAARGLLISTTGRPSVTRSVSQITSNADLLDGGTCP